MTEDRKMPKGMEKILEGLAKSVDALGEAKEERQNEMLSTILRHHGPKAAAVARAAMEGAATMFQVTVLCKKFMPEGLDDYARQRLRDWHINVVAVMIAVLDDGNNPELAQLVANLCQLEAGFVVAAEKEVAAVQEPLHKIVKRDLGLDDN